MAGHQTGHLGRTGLLGPRNGSRIRARGSFGLPEWQLVPVFYLLFFLLVDDFLHFSNPSSKVGIQYPGGLYIDEANLASLATLSPCLRVPALYCAPPPPPPPPLQ